MIKEYGIAKCITEENVASAMADRAKEGYEVKQVIWTGVIEVSPKTPIIDPNKPTSSVHNSFLVIFERDAVIPLGSKPSLKSN